MKIQDINKIGNLDLTTVEISNLAMSYSENVMNTLKIQNKYFLYF